MKKDSLQPKTKIQLAKELAKLRRQLVKLEKVETAHRQQLFAVQESEKNYRVLLDGSSDPIFAFRPDGTYRYVNKAFADGVRRRLDEIIDKKIWDVFPKDEADKRYAVVKWVFENGENKMIEVRVPRPDGDRYYITTAKPIFDERNTVQTVICISKEITERKRMEEELVRLSTRDSLTGLYNRNLFETEISRLEHSRLLPITIVIADIDDLKTINDSAGHNAGDELLRKMARILQQSFRTEDIIARIGGDEFAILLPTTNASIAQMIVARMKSNLAKQREPSILVSIGLATSDQDVPLAEAVRLADERMYKDKAIHKRSKET